MFNKILIANRGEIAIRIIRACRDMGIRTVAVYSKSDTDAMHVRLADEAVCIGPGDTKRSYLNLPNIISAAEITGCEAIHPGYGFLSENSLFAETCEICNIKFIGPHPKTIRMMGNKAEAKKFMQESGIPIISGSKDKLESMDDAVKIADDIGYPIIIKSSYGGGGRGMRIIASREDLTKNFDIVKSEVLNNFGNADVYIEKYIENPKHIEFQILGDTKGNVVHLCERDCSIQRRHQKLIEESPSPVLAAKTRQKMGEVSLKIAKISNYFSAGTIEYLVDEGGNFYFMEVNTRIQVEHPVTEMVTGIDIVKEQIKIAAGEELKVKQKDIVLNGHSIECRVNAEDSVKFMPSCGKISHLHLPGGHGVRVDTAIYNGYQVLPFYDSLLAKVIVHAKDRDEAIKKMKIALNEFQINGIQTTIPFHKSVLVHERFLNGSYSTKFIERFHKQEGK